MKTETMPSQAMSSQAMSSQAMPCQVQSEKKRSKAKTYGVIMEENSGKQTKKYFIFVTENVFVFGFDQNPNLTKHYQTSSTSTDSHTHTHINMIIISNIQLHQIMDELTITSGQQSSRKFIFNRKRKPTHWFISNIEK